MADRESFGSFVQSQQKTPERQSFSDFVTETEKPPEQQGVYKSFMEWAVKPLVDVGGAIGSLNPEDYIRAGKTIADFGNSLIGEPKRIWGELVASGDAMTKGNLSKAAYHLGGVTPLLGAPAQQIANEIGEGKYQDAFGHYLALIVPGVAERGLPAVGKGIRYAPPALRGAGQALIETKPITVRGVTLPVPTTVASAAAGGQAASMMGLPRTAGAIVGGALPVIRGAYKGVTAELAAEEAAAARAAQQSAATGRVPLWKQAGAPAPVTITPLEDAIQIVQKRGGLQTAEDVQAFREDYANVPRSADPERSVQALIEEYSPETRPQLPAEPPTPVEQAEIEQPPTATVSAAGTIPEATVEYNAPGAATTTERTPAQIAKELDQAWEIHHDLADRYQANPTPENEAAAEQSRQRVHELFTEYHGRGSTAETIPAEPAAMPAAAEAPAPVPAPATAPAPAPAVPSSVALDLETALRPEMLYDWLVRNKVSTEMLDRFTPESWQLATEGAGLRNPPTPEEIAAIQSRLAEYEGAGTMPTKAGMTPEEATAAFEQKKATRTRRQKKAAPVEETPAQPTAPATPAQPQTLADLLRGEPQTELGSQLAQSIETVQAGERPAASVATESKRALTQSEKRVEAFAQHFAENPEYPPELVDLLKGAEPNSNALRMIEKLGESLGIEGRPTAEELPAIAERMRQLREGTPTAPAEAGIGDLLTDPDAVANAATERLRKRGTFSGTKLNMAVDPADIADLAQFGAAKIVKGAQKIVGGITEFKPWAEAMAGEFGEAILPHLDRIWTASQELANRVTKDVKRRTMEDLDVRIPDEVRVASKDPTKTVSGQPFHDLDLTKRSEGFLPMRKGGEQAGNDLINRLWQEAINESEAGGGTTAAEAVRSTGARPPDAKFWDESFSLPQRARYWYELSGESFTGKHVDIPAESQPAFIDAVAGTSGGVEPGPNLQRAIGITSEQLQGQPIMTDLRDPASARNALNPDAQDLQSLKYGSFSGTMQYTSGLSKKAPLTTNDVQVASMFGIDGADIGKNPVMYEVLSRFFLKLRDAQNAELPAGAQPWETWQMQAPSWVYERIRKNPAKAAEYDDYSQVFPAIIQKLQDAGVPTPGGKITLDTLMDPRTPNVMSGTREKFLGTPVGTVEVATTRTPRGARAVDMLSQLDQFDSNVPWVRDARARYEQIQRNTMRALSMRNAGQPSLISQLMSEIVGRKLDVSRLDWNGYGTFEGAVNPNVRIPMGGRESSGAWRALNETERKAFLSILGQDLQQEAMAASHFKAVTANPDTYSVFLERYDANVDAQSISQFSKDLGLPVNVAQHPNGVLIDINIGGFDIRPTQAQVETLAQQYFQNDPNVKSITPIARQYIGDYIDRSGYRKAINDLERSKPKQASSSGKPGRSGPTGDTPGEPSNLDRIRQEIQGISRNRDAEFAGWTKATGKRAAKELARSKR